MSDYSILSMLQRRMCETMMRRQPFPEDAEALRHRLAETRAHLLQCLGTMPARVSPETRTEAVVELAGTGVIQERIVYRTEADVWVPAHIYRPADAPADKLPGILIIQGWDLDKYSMPEFKIALAQSGFVVLFPDNRFSGERRRAANGQTEQSNLLAVSQLFGLTFMGMNTWDNMRALDILEARPDVDADRLGVTGLCWGGMQTWTLAALDDRLKVACPVCGTSTYEALVGEFVAWSAHSCYGTYIREWGNYGDVQDIVACIAPRLLLIQNNVNDTWFPIEGFYRVVQEVSRVYRTLGAADKFDHAVRQTHHDITPEFGERVIDWFGRHLIPGWTQSASCCTRE